MKNIDSIVGKLRERACKLVDYPPRVHVDYLQLCPLLTEAADALEHLANSLAGPQSGADGPNSIRVVVPPRARNSDLHVGQGTRLFINGVEVCMLASLWYETSFAVDDIVQTTVTFTTVGGVVEVVEEAPPADRPPPPAPQGPIIKG